MMTTLNNRVSALFADSLQTMFSELNSTVPWTRDEAPPRMVAPLSIWEDDKDVYVEIDVPGFTREDLNVDIHKGRLTIKGKRKTATGSAVPRYQERQFGEFERSVMLDEWVDPNSVDATLQDGVLRLQFAKKAEAHHQRIEINHCPNDGSKRIENQTT